jgi:hypothetical protein
MKFHLMPHEPTWWVWLATIVLLAVGLAGLPLFFVAAIALTAAQGLYFFRKHRSLRPYAVQIRVGYTSLLAVSFLPGLRWLYWLPTLRTAALVLSGYCLMARTLSLLP